MKKFSVVYEMMTSYEAVVKAKSAKEAKKKVLDVIGDDVEITDSWEVQE